MAHASAVGHGHRDNDSHGAEHTHAQDHVQDMLSVSECLTLDSGAVFEVKCMVFAGLVLITGIKAIGVGNRTRSIVDILDVAHLVGTAGNLKHWNIRKNTHHQGQSLPFPNYLRESEVFEPLQQERPTVVL